MFCECCSCQTTWKGWHWRLVCALAEGAQRRQTWRTRSKRSSLVPPPNSSSTVLDFPPTTTRIIRVSRKQSSVTFLRDAFLSKTSKNMIELPLFFLLGTHYFHGQYFSSIIVLVRSHRQQAVPVGPYYVIKMSAPYCAYPRITEQLSPPLPFKIPNFLRIFPWWPPCELKRALSSSCSQCMMTRGCSSWGWKWAGPLSSCMRTSMGSQHQKCTPFLRR